MNTMTLYRLTKYNNAGDKDVDEFNDEDKLRDQVDVAMDEIEAKRIKTYMVSWISDKEEGKWFDED